MEAGAFGLATVRVRPQAVGIGGEAGRGRLASGGVRRAPLPAREPALPEAAEHAQKIFFDARGERFRFFTEKFREARIDRAKISWMVQRFSFCIGERKLIYFGRQMLVGRVGLDE